MPRPPRQSGCSTQAAHDRPVVALISAYTSGRRPSGPQITNYAVAMALSESVVRDATAGVVDVVECALDFASGRLVLAPRECHRREHQQQEEQYAEPSPYPPPGAGGGRPRRIVLEPSTRAHRPVSAFSNRSAIFATRPRAMTSTHRSFSRTVTPASSGGPPPAGVCMA
jgi:hypothetical protein